jgi:hypothetical protein
MSGDRKERRSMDTTKSALSGKDIEGLSSNDKVGIIATVSEAGLPHLSMYTTIQPAGPGGLVLGEFIRGASKRYFRETRKIAFLIMTFSRDYWRGTATWTRDAGGGPEFERLNMIPMFRYNTYFGVDPVDYFDIRGVSEREALPMGGIVLEALKTKAAKGRLKTGAEGRILKPFVEAMFNQLASLKFLSYVGADGYPEILPLIQCQAADSRRLAFSAGLFREELRAIPAGQRVAVFCMNFGIEDVLVRGTFRGLERGLLGELGSIDIDWVYNSMPPNVGQVYPEIMPAPVTAF